MEQTFKQKFEAKFLIQGCGIFTKKTVNKLLGKEKRSGKGKTENQFWYDRKNSVRRALVDVELFIHAANKDNVKQTVNRETLEPVVEALLGYRWPVSFETKKFAAEEVELSPEIAEVAKMFIETGFAYLSKKDYLMTLSHEQTRAAAVDLANYLAESFKAKSEYRRPPGTHGYEY
jgi:hypothetical protein